MGRGAEYYRRNPEKQKALTKAWYQKHREEQCRKARERIRLWKERDPEGLKSYRLASYQRNRKLHIETSSKKYKFLRSEFFRYYGDHCICCGETEKDFLTLDHTNNDGWEHRKRVGNTTGILLDLKKRGWPREGIAVLCMNCNSGKWRNGGICPHVEKATELFLSESKKTYSE